MVRPISRREFLRFAALSAAATIAGCRQAPAAQPAEVVPPTQEISTAVPSLLETIAPTAAPTSAPETGPQAQKGGTFRMLVATDIPALDPPGAAWWVDWWSVGTLLNNMLYSYDKDYKLFPDLAEDMPKVSDDQLVYTIPLRKGVKFHTGRTMTADDVKFTFDHAHWPEVTNWGKSYLSNIVGYQDVIDGKTKDLVGVKALDDFTIQITLAKPQATFIPLLTMTHLGVIPRQETMDAGADFGTKVVLGTGPFKFVEWAPAEKLVYERFDDYFRGAPNLDRIEIYLNVQPAVTMLRYDSGEAEFTLIPDAERERVLNDPQYEPQRIKAVRPTSQRLFINWKKGKPFDDIKVRQAVAHAIDRDGVVKIFGGGAVPIEGVYAPGMLGYDPNFRTKYPYDPEKAKALLAEAGYADGIKGVQMASGYGTAENIQADLKAVGIEAAIMTGSEANYQQMILDGDIPICMGSWAASIPDAYDFISGWSTCASAKLEGTYNFGQYCNEKVDQLVDEAEKLPLMSEERLAKYREIEDIIVNQDVGQIGLYSDVAIGLAKPYVHDAFMSGIYGLPFLAKAWLEKQ